MVWQIWLAAACLPAALAHDPDAHRKLGARSHVAYAPGGTEGRRLQASDVAPLRIHVYGARLEQDVPLNTYRYLTEDVLEAATRWLSLALNVQPVQGPLTFDPSRGRTCGDVSIPSAHLQGSQGVGDADFVLYVSAHDDLACADGGTLGFASACHQDQNDRPIAGHMNYCRTKVLNRDGRSDWDDHVAVSIHEILHALGFSSALFPFFRDDGGRPRTQRDLWGLPPWIGNMYVADSNTIEAEVQHGSTKHYLVLPRVVAAAQEHFGCDSLQRVPLEEAGGEGSAFSHWDAREFYSEVMAPVISDFARVSKMTLALLEDSGWYKPDYSLAGPFHFGESLGCGFLTEECVSNGRTSFPGTFCTNTDVKSCTSNTVGGVAACTHDLLGRAVCDSCMHSSPLPSFLQHFSNPRLGGDRAFMGYCPTWVPYAGTPFCRSEQADDHSFWGESFGEASRCVMSTVVERGYVPLQTPMGSCHEVRCEENRLRIRVGEGAATTWVICNPGDEGQEQTVQDWNGRVVCPSHRVMCRDVTDQGPIGVPCLFPGVLRYGRCVCAAGYIGEDCSVQDTSAVRSSFPLGLRYPQPELALEQAVPLTQTTGVNFWPFQPAFTVSVPGLTFSVSPSLPEGLSFSSTDGTVAGTPTIASDRIAYTVKATGVGGAAATATLFISVVCDSARADCDRTTTVTTTSSTTTVTTTSTTRTTVPGAPTVTSTTVTTSTSTITTTEPESNRRLFLLLFNVTLQDIQASLGVDTSGAWPFDTLPFDTALSNAAGLAASVTGVSAVPGQIRVEFCLAACRAESAAFLAAATQLAEALSDSASGLRLSELGQRYLAHVELYQTTSKTGGQWTTTLLWSSGQSEGDGSASSTTRRQGGGEGGGDGATTSTTEEPRTGLLFLGEDTDWWSNEMLYIAIGAGVTACITWLVVMRCLRTCCKSHERQPLRGPPPPGRVPPQVLGQGNHAAAAASWAAQPTPFAAEALRVAGLPHGAAVAPRPAGGVGRGQSEVENEALGNMMDMGFEFEASLQALQANGWSVDRAVEALGSKKPAESA